MCHGVQAVGQARAERRDHAAGRQDRPCNQRARLDGLAGHDRGLRGAARGRRQQHPPHHQHQGRHTDRHGAAPQVRAGEGRPAILGLQRLAGVRQGQRQQRPARARRGQGACGAVLEHSPFFFYHRGEGGPIHLRIAPYPDAAVCRPREGPHTCLWECTDTPEHASWPYRLRPAPRAGMITLAPIAPYPPLHASRKLPGVGACFPTPGVSLTPSGRPSWCSCMPAQGGRAYI
mmetsp:Transcript_123210/g.349133  ORF Transcript_123210/g.349133 Transcript_123210/m.349133 type:complete len:232 (-) Transcript_123210:169-864(-)